MKKLNALVNRYRGSLYEKTIEVYEDDKYIINVRSRLQHFNWIGARYTIESRCIDVQEVFTVKWERRYYFDVLVEKIIEEAKEKEIKSIVCTFSFKKKGAAYLLQSFIQKGFTVVTNTDEIFIVEKAL